MNNQVNIIPHRLLSLRELRERVWGHRCHEPHVTRGQAPYIIRGHERMSRVTPDV